MIVYFSLIMKCAARARYIYHIPNELNGITNSAKIVASHLHEIIGKFSIICFATEHDIRYIFKVLLISIIRWSTYMYIFRIQCIYTYIEHIYTAFILIY